MDISPETTERDLIEACQDVESEAFDAAFEELFGRYKDRVYSIAYRMSGNAVDAMDVVQDSFRVLFLKIGSFRFDSRFSTWLFRIVVNCSIDHRRRERVRSSVNSTSLSLLESRQEPATEADGPVEFAQSTELGAHVHRALDRLSPKLRAVLVLRYLEGMSYEQLAETLDVQLGTVKSRLARAHLAIEGILAGSLDRFGYESDHPGRSTTKSGKGESGGSAARSGSDENEARLADRRLADDSLADDGLETDGRGDDEPGRSDEELPGRHGLRGKGGVA